MRSSMQAGVNSPGGMLRGGPYQKQTVSRATIKRVLKSFVPYKGHLALIAVCVLLSAGLGLLPPFLLRIIIDKGLARHDFAIVTRYSLYTLLATIGSIALALGFGYLSILVGQRIMRDFRNQLYTHVQSLSLRFFTDTRTGDIQSRLANDVGGVQSVVSDTAATLLSNLTIVISTLGAMTAMNWKLTLLSVGVLPVFAWMGKLIGEVARGVRATAQQQLADLNSTMQETLSISGILLTKTSGRQAMARTRFEKENLALTGSQIKQSIIMRAFFNLIGLTFSITPVLVYWYAGYLITKGDGDLTIGLIVAFTALQSRLFFPLTGLLTTQVEMTSSMALFDRIYEYLDIKPDIADAPNAVRIEPHDVRGAVGFEHVTFRYADTQETPTLTDVSFQARAGELVALVGHSGAGKTTLTYLIPRLYDVESGRITIDGVDVRHIAMESLSKMIAVVTQETYLVHDTIRENLRYGHPDATDDELAQAAKVAAIHDHIMSLPEGYDTVVGERGYKLSGGEKQRISIARAVLKNPRILILDEATSSLDTQSERLVQAALEPLMHGRTTFAIAHRLSTILAADRIVVLDDGQVVEQGTHDYLLANGGLYSRLYKLQFDHGDHAVESATAAG